MDDTILKVFLEVNPDLAILWNSLNNKDSDDMRAKTFADCAKVENDIRKRLDLVNPF